MNQGFWAALDRLVADCALVIDRPRGSAHPHWPDLIYPLDYGYLEGTRGGDGAGVDAWFGSLAARTPRAVTGLVLAVDLRKQEVEVKVLLGCTAAEARLIEAFHTQGRQAGRLVWRSEGEVEP